MRRVDNPPNPYLSEHRELLGPPPPVQLEVYEERAASILTHNDSPDIPFRWTVNPYRGCQHACAYCYARRTHEYLGLGAGTDFESRIIVKINAPELLADELARPAWRHENIAFSGVTDAYQPLEAVYRVTRRCLEACLAAANPVGIVTKSYLIVRDTDLLVELHRRAHVSVSFSIPFADAQVARRLEPHAPPPARQFEAMRRLATAGVPVGILLAPIIPGLNDRDIPQLLKQAVECGAGQAGYAPVRLPGSVQQVFLSRLRAELPDAAARIEQRTRELRGGQLNDPRFGYRMQAAGAYWESVTRLFETTATRLGLDCGQPWRQNLCPGPGERSRPRQLSLFKT
ncbi:MAG: PA0069 family radical SAM protein [Phycisphaerae bacterium]|nr:PA0069 family radical SAM protein [Phycisphaerae bacterium]